MMLYFIKLFKKKYKMKIQYKMVNDEIVNLLFEIIQLEINTDYCKIIAIYTNLFIR